MRFRLKERILIKVKSNNKMPELLNDIQVEQNVDTDSDALKKKESPPKPLPTPEYAESSDADLELLANVKKTKKKSPHKKESPRQKSPKSSKISRRSGSTSERKKERKKTPVEENEDIDIRKKKLDMLTKLDRFYTMNKRTFHLDMTYSLEEIEDMFKRESKNYQNKQGSEFFKTILKLSTRGIELANTTFDPLGINLVGWSDSIGYDIEAEQYDEVLIELYEKYGGESSFGPEAKLLFKLLQSMAMFHLMKKVSSSPESISTFMSMMTGIKPPVQTPIVNQGKDKADTETSDDLVPSKMKDIPYEDIIEKMRESKVKTQEKKKRGRPPKNRNVVSLNI